VTSAYITANRSGQQNPELFTDKGFESIAGFIPIYLSGTFESHEEAFKRTSLIFAFFFRNQGVKYKVAGA